ncbi:MAG: CRISPR-associated endoribonuclease Cas6 [Firmicutes bacterium]|nr:CRISPR-associated endoribonuclease Cas6 [Bacillota bacterium]
MLQYYELTLTVYLQQSIPFQETNEKIAQVINKAMLPDKALAVKHKENRFKYYVFDSLYPLEQDKVYKAGKVYVFHIRSLDKVFVEKMKKLLPKTENPYIKILATEVKRYRQRHIAELYTMTPVLVTIDNAHWILGNDLMMLQQRLQTNLEKKYKTFYDESLNASVSFIQRIEVLNRKPMAYRYKNIKMLGNKLKIAVNEDAISQKLAFIAAACGLGEKGSALGMGFCHANGLK